MGLSRTDDKKNERVLATVSREQIQVKATRTRTRHLQSCISRQQNSGAGKIKHALATDACRVCEGQRTQIRAIHRRRAIQTQPVSVEINNTVVDEYLVARSYQISSLSAAVKRTGQLELCICRVLKKDEHDLTADVCRV